MGNPVPIPPPGFEEERSMTLPVSFRPLAQDDVESAMSWYGEKGPALDRIHVLAVVHPHRHQDTWKKRRSAEGRANVNATVHPVTALANSASAAPARPARYARR